MSMDADDPTIEHFAGERESQHFAGERPTQDDAAPTPEWRNEFYSSSDLIEVATGRIVGGISRGVNDTFDAHLRGTPVGTPLGSYQTRTFAKAAVERAIERLVAGSGAVAPPAPPSGGEPPTVQRFGLVADGLASPMQHEGWGDFVRVADYEALATRAASLEAENATLRSALDNVRLGARGEANWATEPAVSLTRIRLLNLCDEALGGS